MKRVLMILAALTMLLSGCSANETKEPEATDVAATAFVPVPTAGITATVAPTPTPIPLTGAALWTDISNKKGIDTSAVIMTEEAIKAFNRSLSTVKGSGIVDMDAFPSSMDQKELYTAVTSSSAPGMPKYKASGEEITMEEYEAILKNRNLNEIKNSNNFKLGVVVQRTNIRTVPSDEGFFNNSGDKIFDRIQESELYVGLRVYVMHQSMDKAFYFIQSSYYSGWVHAEDIAIANNKEDWRFFSDTASGSFVTVTEPMVEIDGIKLDMGITLPLVKEEGETFTVAFPAKGESSELIKTEKNIPAVSAVKGYMPYTAENVFKQAFKYEGRVYGWGGLLSSVDCSSYAASVFRTFGFAFPRNTSQQMKVIGKIYDASGRTEQEIKNIIDKAKYPLLLYTSSHVMIYLGEKDGAYYMINASSSRGKITVEANIPFANLIVMNEVICD